MKLALETFTNAIALDMICETLMDTNVGSTESHETFPGFHPAPASLPSAGGCCCLPTSSCRYLFVYCHLCYIHLLPPVHPPAATCRSCTSTCRSCASTCWHLQILCSVSTCWHLYIPPLACKSNQPFFSLLDMAGR